MGVNLAYLHLSQSFKSSRNHGSNSPGSRSSQELTSHCSRALTSGRGKACANCSYLQACGKSQTSLFGDCLILSISSLTVFIASRHMITFETAPWKTKFLLWALQCMYIDSLFLYVLDGWRALVSPTCSQQLVCQECCQWCFRTIGWGEIGGGRWRATIAVQRSAAFYRTAQPSIALALFFVWIWMCPLI